MISESRPRTSSTAVRRRCSSSSVPDSLKSGTTIERSKQRALLFLRGMAKAPCGRVCEVMTNQLDLLVKEGHADYRDPETLGQSHDDREHRGTRVHVRMRIEMRQPNAFASNAV